MFLDHFFLFVSPKKFACGRFMATAEIPAEKSRMSVFDPLSEEIYLRGRTLLEEDPSEDDFESYKLARAYFRSCMNEARQEEVGVEPLKKVLRELGGWPVLEGPSWNSKKDFTW